MSEIDERTQSGTTPISANTGNCTDDKKDLGYITFLVGQDLYLISGNGCRFQLIMENVSDSPAWSPNGKWIAVGCQNNLKLCFIETYQVIHNTSPISRVTPQVTKFFDLPENCSRHKIRSISWSPNGNFVAVACVVEGKTTEIYILSLQQGSYQKVLTDNEILRAIWSPVDENILVSTLKGDIYTIDLEGKNPKFLTTGWSPEWSGDGQKIAFIKPSDDKSKSQMGLAVLDLSNQAVNWLYLPSAGSEHLNLILSCGDLRFDCRLAWSPNNRYIAVGARYGSMFNWDIFRLDITTGEIINLTENLDTTKNYEPDWGR